MGESRSGDYDLSSATVTSLTALVILVRGESPKRRSAAAIGACAKPRAKREIDAKCRIVARLIDMARPVRSLSPLRQSFDEQTLFRGSPRNQPAGDSSARNEKNMRPQKTFLDQTSLTIDWDHPRWYFRRLEKNQHPAQHRHYVGSRKYREDCGLVAPIALRHR